MYLWGTSLVVQWLGLCAFIAEGLGSIPGWGTKIPQAVQCGKKKEKNKDLPLTSSRKTTSESLEYLD